MKQLVDIHTILSTWHDMEDVHEDPDVASEKLNMILHMVYDNALDDIDTQTLNNMLAYTWKHWHVDRNLADIDEDDLVDWVDHLMANWDDIDAEEESIE